MPLLQAKAASKALQRLLLGQTRTPWQLKLWLGNLFVGKNPATILTKLKRLVVHQFHANLLRHNTCVVKLFLLNTRLVANQPSATLKQRGS